MIQAYAGMPVFPQPAVQHASASRADALQPPQLSSTTLRLLVNMQPS